MCHRQNTNIDIFLCIPDYQISRSVSNTLVPASTSNLVIIMHLQNCHKENLGLTCFSASASCKLQNMATLSVLKIRSSSS